MSKRKSAIGGILRDVYNWPPTAYKQCEICGEEIATENANWKYKYCLSCTHEQIDKFRKESHRGSNFRGGFRKTQIEQDYKKGKRWLKDRCEICGYSDVLEAHRIVPGKHGGEYTKYNTMTLCPNCHALITTKKKELKVEYNGDNRIANLINHA